MANIIEKIEQGNEQTAQKLEELQKEQKGFMERIFGSRKEEDTIDKLEGVTQRATELETENGDLKKQLGDLNAKVADLTEQLEAKTKEVVDVNQEVNKKVAQQLAQPGTPAVDEKGDSSPNIIDQYNALSGAAKTRFFQQHKQAIYEARI